MPNIADLTNEPRGCKVFSKLDSSIRLPVAEADQPKTAITTPFGFFIYRCMPVGLRKAQTFQRLIDKALRDLPFAKTYMDYIFIASEDKQDHLKHLEIIFQWLRKNGLSLKAR